MEKIEPLHNWSAGAALHSALEVTKAEDRVLVLIEHADGYYEFRAANCTLANIIYMLERHKFEIFNE